MYGHHRWCLQPVPEYTRNFENLGSLLNAMKAKEITAQITLMGDGLYEVRLQKQFNNNLWTYKEQGEYLPMVLCKVLSEYIDEEDRQKFPFKNESGN
ncbi:MAG: hypothetical protein AABY22_01460, partial [Nanoarchaeota archaeon]